MKARLKKARKEGENTGEVNGRGLRGKQAPESNSVEKYVNLSSVSLGLSGVSNSGAFGEAMTWPCLR